MSLFTFFAGLAAPPIALLPNPRNIYIGGINGVGCARNFPSKRVSEIEVYTVDYANELAPGETILTAVWSNTVYEGRDTSPGAMTRGGASIIGSQVSQIIGGGVNGVSYSPICTVTTSGGQVLVLPEPGCGLLLVVG